GTHRRGDRGHAGWHRAGVSSGPPRRAGRSAWAAHRRAREPFVSHAHRMLLLAHAAAGSVEHDRARTIRDAIAELTSAPVELCTPDSPGNYAEAVASAAGADIVILGG